MSGETPAKADIVIVGAGLAGAATAHALRGRDLVLLERAEAPGRESSGRSASMIRQDVGDEALADLVAEGAMAHRTGRLGPFRPTGSFLLGRGDEDLALRVPVAQGRGRFVEGDGVVDAAALLATLLAGQRVLTGCEVARIEPGREGLDVALTNGRRLSARVVVTAAGAWAGRVGALPLEPRRRHLFVTAPCGASDEWPFAWDDAAGYYFRAEGAGLLLCACDQRATPPGENDVEDAVEDLLREKLRRHQPRLAELPIVKRWAGQRTFARDGRFVIGWDRRVEGLFHVAGLGGHGVTVAPAVGALAGRLVAAGPQAEPPPAARPLAPDRLIAG